MGEVQEIGPLVASVEATQIRFCFADPEAVLLSLPPALEGELSDFARDNQRELATKPVVMDLCGIRFVSSRQLGVMLTVRKALSPDRSVSLLNVSPTIRRVLAVTGLEKYFDVAGAPDQIGAS